MIIKSNLLLALPATAGFLCVVLQDMNRIGVLLIAAEDHGHKALDAATEQVDQAEVLELMGEVAEAKFRLSNARER